jgi:hypothetical protein
LISAVAAIIASGSLVLSVLRISIAFIITGSSKGYATEPLMNVSRTRVWF